MNIRESLEIMSIEEAYPVEAVVKCFNTDGDRIKDILLSADYSYKASDKRIKSGNVVRVEAENNDIIAFYTNKKTEYPTTSIIKAKRFDTKSLCILNYNDEDFIYANFDCEYNHNMFIDINMFSYKSASNNYNPKAVLEDFEKFVSESTKNFKGSIKIIAHVSNKNKEFADSAYIAGYDVKRVVRSVFEYYILVKEIGLASC